MHLKYLAVLPAFALGFLSMYLYYPYPEPDLVGMQEFAEAQNRIHGGRIFSEARPVHISDHFRLKTPVVLVTVSCDIPASYVRAFTQLFDSHIPIYFDIILIPFTPRDQFEWDVQPCETFHDILPPSGIWRTESGGWTDGAATPDCAAPWRGMGCGL